MSAEAAKFFVEWLEANVSAGGAAQGQDIAQLAARCLSDAAAHSISRAEIEAVVGDIDDSIRDELEYLAVLKSMSPSQS